MPFVCVLVALLHIAFGPSNVSTVEPTTLAAQGTLCKCSTGVVVTPGVCPCEISFQNQFFVKGRCYLLESGCSDVPEVQCSVTGTIVVTGSGCPGGGALTLYDSCGGDPKTHLELCPFTGTDTTIVFTCGDCP